MPRRKKKFICGHKGYGQICHRCQQQRAEVEKRRQYKLDWEATFAEDPIDLRNLPKNVVLKSRRIIHHLQSQGDYHQFHGKRLLSVFPLPVVIAFSVAIVVLFYFLKQ